jgi:lysylphosphatidylglycerol synthetase-like protein (DUF2156 family)
MQSWDWKWIIGSVVIPIATLVIGLFVGRHVEKSKHTKNTAKVKGKDNTVIQASKIEKK